MDKVLDDGRAWVRGDGWRITFATQAQVQKLAILLGERGVDDRDARLAFISDRVGRPIASSKDLDTAEASALINALEQGEGTA